MPTCSIILKYWKKKIQLNFNLIERVRDREMRSLWNNKTEENEVILTRTQAQKIENIELRIPKREIKSFMRKKKMPQDIFLYFLWINI